ncbi:PucR family transcriptional regulator [Amycolatopsis rhabdoformis]|uniref:PucR family transcriptional regulator n=1 Tax=Amycolatopsis rhabdoformis TaxID=1448059 RepID=A0ABZ1I589_9PSEU|nr:PucR family transcriptional regulator [Amycolatopsis rhabdoformis]WSE29594.1 PucR family transcriptional regulator [Amycolatopsis rhabdoformis]
MALTLRALTEQRALGLHVVAGERGLDRPIGWVHPTELTDPQAFLEGGELLLTTGLALDDATSAAYVQRLVDAGVAGLGFGVGLSHDHVPKTLVETADEVGLPVLEVPRKTPFIAITRAVSRAVAADEYAATVRIGRAQQELTRAAVGRSGTAGVVRKLAQLIDGWVVLFDSPGRVAAAAPAAAQALGAELDVKNLRTGTRVVALGQHEVVLQTLHPHGVLAVGTTVPLDATGRHIVNTAVALLSLALKQDRAHQNGLRYLRTAVLDLLAEGRADAAMTTISTVWGEVPDPPWRVLYFQTRSPGSRQRLYDRFEAELSPQQVFFARHGIAVTAVTAVDAVLEEQLITLAGEGAYHVGIAETSEPQGFPDALRQAEQAAEAAESRGLPVLRYADHAGRGLLNLLEPLAAQAFAHELLAPLRDRPDLEESLRAWLEDHGHWDRAATRLGVHRHTLRNRITKVSELLGQDLDSPGVRAELWLALQVTG